MVPESACQLQLKNLRQTPSRAMQAEDRRLSDVPPPLSFPALLPDQLQPQLNLPRGSGPDHACIDDRLPARIKYGIICVIQKIGSRKVGMIQNIEELSSELHIERFREFWDMRVLENREVYRLEAWSIQAVSACMVDEV